MPARVTALTSGQGGINYLFGEVKAVTLAGIVYHDANDNGALDSGETGISGVTVSPVYGTEAVVGKALKSMRAQMGAD